MKSFLSWDILYSPFSADLPGAYVVSETSTDFQPGYFFFFGIPFYLQAVQAHLANGVNTCLQVSMYTESCREALRSPRRFTARLFGCDNESCSGGFLL
jgi:hypothetical protein